ncbi:MAG: right-handed parallel beta-helix repeat-containing protein [Actinobacteria bacterium]|nr:right-handed parallel beta-helix repeat-containing protein [Actinomycetota bacterium]
MTVSGSADAPITIGAVPGAARPRITPSGSSNSVVLLDGVHDVKLSGLEVAGNPTRWGAGIRVRGGSSRVVLSDLYVHDNRSFGLLLEDVTHTLVASSRLSKNETGLQVSRAGAGVRIVGNDVHDNDRLIVDDEQRGNDRGANAMVFYRTRGPLTVEGNRAWGNRGTSHDYGFDGGAFEVYAASGLTIRDNVVWNNQNVMETGTDGTLPCAGNSFTGNVAYGASRSKPAMGLILRCAKDMLVANNTLDDFDKFAIDVNAEADSFGGSIEGLRVVRNIAVSSGDKLLSIDSGLPRSVVIDDNLLFNRLGRYVGYVAGRGNTRSLGTFVAWTGLQSGGIQADPLFVGAASADYRLREATPAPTWGARKALDLARRRGPRCQKPAATCPRPAHSPRAAGRCAATSKARRAVTKSKTSRRRGNGRTCRVRSSRKRPRVVRHS